MPDQDLINGVCPHDCPDACGIRSTVVGDRVIEIKGHPGHVVTGGWLCAKVTPYLEQVYHPDRLLYPLRRDGPKGNGAWRAISWDEAIDQISDRWRGIVRTSGPEAILPYSYSGTLGLVQMTLASSRFWNRLGASRLVSQESQAWRREGSCRQFRQRQRIHRRPRPHGNQNDR